MMLPAVDETHDPQLTSWVSDANGHLDFPIQNLPLGIFEPRTGVPRGGIAIGEHILDLPALCASGLLAGPAQAACLAGCGPTLNPLLGLGSVPRAALRQAASRILAEGSPRRFELLHRASECRIYLPAMIGDYTDFYAGIHHAFNVGRLFRPDAPLLPNYKWVPIGYHGRASSIRPSGSAVRRPSGQRRLPEQITPDFGPSRSLDFELELGIWIGPGNDLGASIPMHLADEHISGYCLLNDWSARDLQSWEYQPLGPFLAKSFHTTCSSWIVTPEALAPFRLPQTPRPDGDPPPLPYLQDDADQAGGALNLELEVMLLTAAMREHHEGAQRISKSHASHLYWTPQQLVAHHSSNGCNLQPGDLLGTGTISSARADGLGSLLEITCGGRESIRMGSTERRTYLEDGDEVIFRARASRVGYISIGFGACSAVVAPAAEPWLP